MEKYSKDSKIVYNNDWLIEEIERVAVSSGIKFNKITLTEGNFTTLHNDWYSAANIEVIFGFFNFNGIREIKGYQLFGKFNSFIKLYY
jgi:hypothetical protein